MKNNYIIDGDICWIELTQGQWCQIDVDDMLLVGKYRWCSQKRVNTFYVTAYEKSTRKKITVHRLILNTPCGYDTDHISRQGTDNRRVNLRVVTRSQNSLNRNSKKGSSSRFLGVFRSKQKKKWRSLISLDGTKKHIGYYNTEEKARDARAIAFVAHFGTDINPDQTRIAQEASAMPIF